LARLSLVNKVKYFLQLLVKIIIYIPDCHKLLKAIIKVNLCNLVLKIFNIIFLEFFEDTWEGRGGYKYKLRLIKYA